MTKEELIKLFERGLGTEEPPFVIPYNAYVHILMEIKGITKEEAEKITDKQLEDQKNG